MEEIEALCGTFVSAVKAIDDDDMEIIASAISDIRVLELMFVALLGLKGIETLRFANHHVPDCYVNLKPSIIQKMLSSVIPYEDQLVLRPLHYKTATKTFKVSMKIEIV